tara:strand:- start:629 stop:730 length:102 start_codon:yes stop_codon:yes gene_type:complete
MTTEHAENIKQNNEISKVLNFILMDFRLKSYLK